MKPDKSYLEFIRSLKQKIINRRYQAARLANREQLLLYYKTGKMLSDKVKVQKWGTKEQGWPLLREAKTNALYLPQTGKAVSLDVGDANDIHAVDKRTVGNRLALNALHLVYGKEVVYADLCMLTTK